MFDFVVLGLAIVLMVIAVNPRWHLQVGKLRRTPASARFKFCFVFPLGASLSMIAGLRLIGYLNHNLCHTCMRVGYGVVTQLYFGWVFTFIGLLGLRSFATTKKLANRSLIVIASICGPLLLAFGFFEIVVRIKA